MRRNYFVKLINYMKKVYKIEDGIGKLKEGRVNPKYKTAQVIMQTAQVIIWGVAIRKQAFIRAYLKRIAK